MRAEKAGFPLLIHGHVIAVKQRRIKGGGARQGNISCMVHIDWNEWIGVLHGNSEIGAHGRSDLGCPI